MLRKPGTEFPSRSSSRCPPAPQCQRHLFSPRYFRTFFRSCAHPKKDAVKFKVMVFSSVVWHVLWIYDSEPFELGSRKSGDQLEPAPPRSPVESKRPRAVAAKISAPPRVCSGRWQMVRFCFRPSGLMKNVPAVIALSKGPLPSLPVLGGNWIFSALTGFHGNEPGRGGWWHRATPEKGKLRVNATSD